jgi:signal transduction histidine kinase
VVGVRAVHRPTPANLDTAAFFGIFAFVIVESRVLDALGIERTGFISALNSVLAMALPFFLLRLVDDFAPVPRPLMWGALIALVLIDVALLAFPSPRPGAVTGVAGLYFVALSLYSSFAFVRHARRSHGVTRRRMTVVGWGSALLGVTIALAVVPALLPGLGDQLAILVNLGVLASALAYFVGFAPPRFLRRAWQEGELRGFLSRAAQLPRLPSTAEIVRELEHGAAAATGASATIGLWLPEEGVLRFTREDGTEIDIRPGEFIAGRVFRSQDARFFRDARREDPEHAAVYSARGEICVVGAPITAGERKLGVLLAYAPRPPVFAQDDLELVQLLADQAAVILESRALIDEAARVRAREQAARLKEDFLSAAAHDLKTPLTTIIGQAQALEARAARDRHLAPELPSIQRLVREGQRLRSLVNELLDASRLERGALVGETEPTDLAGLAQEVAQGRSDAPMRLIVEAADAVVASCDRLRMGQVLDNLIDNALKFSPSPSPVHVRVWADDGEARCLVSDEGIGIPAEDLPHIFERFRRAGNVDERRYPGMGLGLYISRGITEQHGGRIWVESTPGRGTTFHVALPLAVSSSKPLRGLN